MCRLLLYSSIPVDFKFKNYFKTMLTILNTYTYEPYLFIVIEVVRVVFRFAAFYDFIGFRMRRSYFFHSSWRFIVRKKKHFHVHMYNPYMYGGWTFYAKLNETYANTHIHIHANTCIHRMYICIIRSRARIRMCKYMFSAIVNMCSRLFFFFIQSEERWTF